MAKKAIYPGSFDPVTFGHLDVIKRATQIFDEVIVAVATNTLKAPIFNPDERVDMLREATKDITGVCVESFSGLIVNYAREKECSVLIRGLRMISDFENEYQMALTNRRLNKQLETVFLMPSEGHTFLSSTLLKEAAALGADISSFVPSFIEQRLKTVYRKNDMQEIHIHDIGEYGLKVDDSISVEEIGLTKEDYVHFLEPLHVSVKILKAELTVLCTVSVTSRIETFCSRSLENIVKDWHVNFNVDFDIEPNQQIINIQEDIRQEVILRLPIRVISDEEQQTNRIGKELEKLNKNNASFIEEEGQPEGMYRPFEGLEDIK